MTEEQKQILRQLTTDLYMVRENLIANEGIPAEEVDAYIDECANGLKKITKDMAEGGPIAEEIKEMVVEKLKK